MVWTKEEIEYYKKIQRKELDKFYSKAHLPENNPEARMGYLKNLFREDSVIFTFPTRISEENNGKVGSLRLLEDRIAERFF